MSRIVRTSFARARSSARCEMPLMYSVEKCVPVMSSALLWRMKSSAMSSSAIAMSAQFSRRKISGNVSRSLIASTTAAVSRRGSTDTCEVSQPSFCSVSTRKWPSPSSPMREIMPVERPEARAAERGVGGGAAEVLREAGRVLEAGADLLRVEVDGEPAEAEDVEAPIGGEAGAVLHDGSPEQCGGDRGPQRSFRRRGRNEDSALASRGTQIPGGAATGRRGA